jgi:hypothetical protein
MCKLQTERTDVKKFQTYSKNKQEEVHLLQIPLLATYLTICNSILFKLYFQHQ